MRQIVKLLLASLVVVFALGAIPVGWIAWRVNTAKPVLSGEVRVAGLSGETVIARDEYGVPHIFATTEEDVYFAMGFAHAQDRYFQMDMIRRDATGRLAALLGPRVVDHDVRKRLLGHHEAAQASARLLDGPERDAIEAYVAGVNAALQSDIFVTPPEYAFLFASPEPWTVEDTAAVFVFMADDLSTGLRRDADRLLLSQTLGEARLAEFSASDPDFATSTLKAEDRPPAPTSGEVAGGASAAPAGQAVGVSDSLTPPTLRGGGGNAGDVGGSVDLPPGGSNAWALDGSRTDSGRPMLAADPHLTYSTPGAWYLARLSLPTGDVSGATLPGAPFIAMGRNERAAWAFTASAIDEADWVWVPDDDVRPADTEVIAVRFGQNVEVTPAVNAHGRALMAPHFTAAGAADGFTQVLKTSVDRDNNPAALFYALNAGRTYDDIIAAAQLLKTPSLNFLYAERGETFDEMTASLVDDPAQDLIAYQLLGRTPRRDVDGVWEGVLSPGDNPRVVNPQGGMIVSSNNAVLPQGDPWVLPGEFQVYRALRAEARLRASRLHDIDSFASVQLDVTSSFAARMAPLFARARPMTQEGRVLQVALSNWDGRMGPNDVEPLMFFLWQETQPALLWGDETGEAFSPRRGAAGRVLMEQAFSGELAHWCDDVTTPTSEDCGAMMGRALDQAGVILMDTFGDEPEDWRWGAVRQAEFPHPLSGRFPFAAGAFDRRADQAGGDTTLNVSVSRREGDAFRGVMGAQFRAVYDLADLESAAFIVAPGQSGYPASPHYDDLLPLWSAGQYITIPADWPLGDPPIDEPFTDWITDNASPGSSILTLLPAGPGE